MEQEQERVKVLRCSWANGSILERDYHDQYWGREIHNDQQLFQKLSLEGMQAGLSWLTILKKWDAFDDAFDTFDINKVAVYGEEKIHTLMTNAGIVRNELKIRSVIKNAQLCLDLIEKYGTFDDYLWGFIDGKRIVNHPESIQDVPAQNELSQTISKALKKEGFNFVGPTIMYAFMQSVGMVDDHLESCAFKYVV